MKGVGYRAIASVLGLSRDVVRNYCKSHGLNGYASDLTVNMKELIKQNKACLMCGKKLNQPATGRRRKFCSDECRRKWWLKHPEAIQKKESAYYEKTCIYCGKEFKTYGNKNRKYCSHDCYIHDRFWRKEEGREPYKSPSVEVEEMNE
jgi:endogenous inhibitor of DNA gyrase (YacG/DUF329 family)